MTKKPFSIALAIVVIAGLGFWGCSKKDNPTSPSTTPVAPILISPVNGDTGIVTNPTLTWKGSSGAASYTVQVSADSLFGSFILNQSGLAGTSQAISGLDTSTTYYWRVSATNSFGTSVYSTVYIFTTNATGMIGIEWVSIPPGNFNMGSDSADPYYYADEMPQHTVYLDAYQISKYAITNAQYNVFMDAGGYTDSTYWTTEGWVWHITNSINEPAWWIAGSYNSGMAYPNHPVVGISWHEAYAFCKWVGGSLPTEAQWEKAARGTVASNFWPWGSTWDAAKCNSYYNILPDTFTYSSPVGFFSAGQSYYGVYDMAGNVREWVNDWYSISYYSVSPSSNPTGPATGSNRITRGGGFFKYDYNCRTAFRSFYSPVNRDIIIGIRPVK